MPISDPRDRFLYPNYTSMNDTYSLVHALRQLTRDTRSDVSCLQELLTRRNEKLRITFGVGRHTIVNCKNSKEIVEMLETKDRFFSYLWH